MNNDDTLNLSLEQLNSIALKPNGAYVVPVIEIEGELGFEIPDDLMEKLELKPGDALAWEETDRGYLLSKVK